MSIVNFLSWHPSRAADGRPDEVDNSMKLQRCSQPDGTMPMASASVTTADPADNHDEPNRVGPFSSSLCSVIESSRLATCRGRYRRFPVRLLPLDLLLSWQPFPPDDDSTAPRLSVPA